MSVLLVAASVQNFSSAIPPNFGAAYTWLAWVYPVTIASDPTPFSISTDASNYDQLYINTGVFRWRASTTAGGAVDCVGSLAVVANAWVCVAGRRDSSTIHTLFAGLTPAGITQQDQSTLDVSARVAANRFDIGSFRNASNFYNGQIIGAKLFTSALTLAEIKTEAARLTPAAANNYGWWPLVTATAAEYRNGGNPGGGLDLTVAGTPTTAGDPPDLLWERNQPASGKIYVGQRAITYRG